MTPRRRKSRRLRRRWQAHCRRVKAFAQDHFIWVDIPWLAPHEHEAYDASLRPCTKIG